MARFTNVATLSYNGGAAESNVVTGEILETLSAGKTAVSDDYTARDDVTYVISLVNSGTAALTGLTVRDDLGGYVFGGERCIPWPTRRAPCAITWTAYCRRLPLWTAVRP